MSKTTEVFDSIYAIIRGSNFNAPYGVLDSTGASPSGKKYKSITFGRARTLDAEVRIYGPSFIMIRTSRHGQQVFRDATNAIDFIKTL